MKPMTKAATTENRDGHDEAHRATGMYGRLAAMMVASFAAMYILMYAMVSEAGNALPNSNQAYMAGLMTAPMLVLEMALMGMMYPMKRARVALILAGLALLAVFWAAIRTQAAIGDRQFIRSMVPHHSGAILMCTKAKLTDPELVRLCGEIVQGQQREIDQMKAILARMKD